MTLLNLNPEFNPISHLKNPICFSGVPEPSYVELFDHNGYDLTKLEQLYCISNNLLPQVHRHSSHISLRKEWFRQEPVNCGPILNHSYIFERKGYTGEALEQLREWALVNPMMNKVINISPKWGIDFSMDYVDRTGESFELFHYEYDSFSLPHIHSVKIILETIVKTTDWEMVAEDLLKRKSEWINLEFFEQSDWKCRYFGVPSERFKMVCWQS